MASDARPRLVAALALLAATAQAWAQQAPPPRPPIYSCVDGNGKRITSDRPIVDCTKREQRVLNTDGSVSKVIPPSMTQEETEAEAARQRELDALRSDQREAARRERLLMQQFPNEAKHGLARTKALDAVRSAMRISEGRIAALKEERKPLLDEAEFYVNKPMPSKLKIALDANDATVEATKATMQFQQEEIGRINAKYDEELARLRKLWAGATPGSPAAPPAGNGAALSATSAKPPQR